MKFVVRVQQHVFQVEISGRAPDYDLVVDGRPLRVNATSLGDESLLTMLLDNRSTLAHTRIADVRRGLYDVSIGGKYRRLEVLDELALSHELPRLILEWRALQKLKGTYIDTLPSSRGTNSSLRRVSVL